MAPESKPRPEDELDRLIARHAGFRERTAAALADLAVLIVVQTFLFLPIGWEWMGEPPEEKAWLFPLAVAWGVPVLYDILLTASRGQATLGKRLAGIYVADLEGRRITLSRAFARHMLKYLSAATLGIGILIQPFTYRKQALHDYLSGTVVRER